MQKLQDLILPLQFLIREIAEDVINLIRSQEGFISKEKRFPNKETLNKVYSFSVNTGRTVEEIIEENYPHFIEQLDKILDIQKIYIEYKRKNNLA